MASEGGAGAHTVAEEVQPLLRDGETKLDW